jgi:hypothetical protein
MAAPSRLRLVAGWSAILTVVLTALASVLLVGAYGFDLRAVADPGTIVDRGPTVAANLRLALLVDMTSYLPLAPVVLYLHRRLRSDDPGLMGLVTVCGLAYVLMGAIGGAILAAGTPPLIADYGAASAAGREASRVTFVALTDAVEIGVWGTLELIPFGIWALGIAWFLRADWPRFALVVGLAGVGALAASLRTAVVARSLVDISGPLDVTVVGLLGLFFPAALWLGLQLLRGAEPGGSATQGA